jgi:hypothetical protein
MEKHYHRFNKVCVTRCANVFLAVCRRDILVLACLHKTEGITKPGHPLSLLELFIYLKGLVIHQVQVPQHICTVHRMWHMLYPIIFICFCRKSVLIPYTLTVWACIIFCVLQRAQLKNHTQHILFARVDPWVFSYSVINVTLCIPLPFKFLIPFIYISTFACSHVYKITSLSHVDTFRREHTNYMHTLANLNLKYVSHFWFLCFLWALFSSYVTTYFCFWFRFKYVSPWTAYAYLMSACHVSFCVVRTPQASEIIICHFLCIRSTKMHAQLPLSYHLFEKPLVDHTKLR